MLEQGTRTAHEQREEADLLGLAQVDPFATPQQHPTSSGLGKDPLAGLDLI